MCPRGTTSGHRGTGVVDASVARAVARRASTDVTDAEEYFFVVSGATVTRRGGASGR